MGDQMVPRYHPMRYSIWCRPPIRFPSRRPTQCFWLVLVCWSLLRGGGN